jgi:hypothetical protein
MSFEDLPTRSLESVYHIGSLDPGKRGSRFSSSYEGHGLSVSLDPSDWQRIAKLGGSPWWCLTKENGLFLEANALTPAQLLDIEGWAIATGYAERLEAYHVIYWDSELESDLAIAYSDKEKADEEAAELEELGGRVEKVSVLQGTERFCEETGLPSALGQTDQLLSLYVAACTEMDGVWWEDEFGAYSAPKGCIVFSKLDSWERELVREGDE